jgi:probable phosphoglycerate mutase
MSTVLAVRHGQTAWNRTGRMQGWAPVRLDDTGRAQARRLGPRLADRWAVDRVVSSDLERTLETASVLAEAGSLPEAARDSAFRERHVGRYQGLPKEPLRAADGGRPDLPDISDVDVTPEGGESLRTMAERVRAGFASLVETAEEDETVLLVTHGGPIRTLLGAAHDQSLSVAMDAHDPGNCSVTAFESTDGEPAAATRPEVQRQ